MIARGGEAVVKIVAVPTKPKRKMIGSARGKIWVFDEASSPEMNREIQEFLNNNPLFSEDEH